MYVNCSPYEVLFSFSFSFFLLMYIAWAVQFSNSFANLISFVWPDNFIRTIMLCTNAFHQYKPTEFFLLQVIGFIVRNRNMPTTACLLTINPVYYASVCVCIEFNGTVWILDCFFSLFHWSLTSYVCQVPLVIFPVCSKLIFCPWSKVWWCTALWCSWQQQPP